MDNFIQLEIPNAVPAECDLNLEVYPNDPSKYDYLWIINHATVGKTPEIVYSTSEQHIGSPRNVTVILIDRISGATGHAYGFFNVKDQILNYYIESLVYTHYNVLSVHYPSLYSVNLDKIYSFSGWSMNNFFKDSTKMSFNYDVSDTFPVSVDNIFYLILWDPRFFPDESQLLKDTLRIEKQDFCAEPDNYYSSQMTHAIWEKEYSFPSGRRTIVQLNGRYYQEE